VKEDNINPEVKRKWVAALRSGEYRQGEGALHNLDTDGNHRFCCLGVLTDLAIKDGVVEDWALGNKANLQCEGQVAYLPEPVAIWAVGDPLLALCDFHVEVAGEHNTLAGCNDDGYTFEQIADIIEEQL
jgi:hypothetical protein